MTEYEYSNQGFGYESLILWEHEINNDISKIIRRIEEFGS